MLRKIFLFRSKIKDSKVILKEMKNEEVYYHRKFQDIAFFQNIEIYDNCKHYKYLTCKLLNWNPLLVHREIAKKTTLKLTRKASFHRPC